jgi:hypothetical protein
MRAPSIVFWAALLSLCFQAQSNAATATSSAAVADDSAAAATVPSSDNSISAPSTSAAAEGDAVSTPAQQTKAPTQTPKPSKPKPSSDSDRPPIEGSMVGYIDNAIVGNEIRIRFDAGFGTNFPDRAEFFYAQCGCDGPAARGPKPGLATDLNFQQLYVRGEYAPIKRLSFLAEVPVRWIQPLAFAPGTVPIGQKPFGNQAAISDVQAGFKFALLDKPAQYLTFQFIASFPSGDSTRGLGTGHYSVAPSLLYFQKFTDRLSFEAQVGDSHPISSSGQLDFAGDVFMYGFGPSYVLYRGEKVRFAPVIELVGWHVLGGLENNADALINTGNPLVNVGGTNVVNLKVGARTSIGNHNSFYMGYGQALTHDFWYRQILRVEYRYTF